MKTTSLFAREGSNMVIFSIEKDSLVVSSENSSMGEARFTIPTLKKEGKDNKITFNYKFLLDYLGHAPDEIMLELLNSFTPGLFKGVKNKEYLHIIMPIRTQ